MHDSISVSMSMPIPMSILLLLLQKFEPFGCIVRVRACSGSLRLGYFRARSESRPACCPSVSRVSVLLRCDILDVWARTGFSLVLDAHLSGIRLGFV
jgi:hypothetical protein